MKIAVNVAKIITGVLFIFSGLVKAIDPRGLAYKMQEFFEAFANEGWLPRLMSQLNDYALGFSIVMITLEVILGVALLLGFKRKITTFLLLLLMILFTFLTSYVLFSGKIRACGCFGDCIPITPVQTFAKDIILLLLIILLIIGQRFLLPLAKPFISGTIIVLATGATILLQCYVLRHLPMVDCLPFKTGNNIMKLREMPADAIPDKFDYLFVYKKGNEQKEFKADALPDSTWEFVDRKQMLVEKGKNNIPLINDFNLTDSSGNDVTAQVLNSNSAYYLLFLQEINVDSKKWLKDIKLISEETAIPFYVASSQTKNIARFLATNKIDTDGIFSLDATAIKTAARSTPTLYKMKGPVVVSKWGWADFDEVQP